MLSSADLSNSYSSSLDEAVPDAVSSLNSTDPQYDMSSASKFSSHLVRAAQLLGIESRNGNNFYALPQINEVGDQSEESTLEPNKITEVDISVELESISSLSLTMRELEAKFPNHDLYEFSDENKGTETGLNEPILDGEVVADLNHPVSSERETGAPISARSEERGTITHEVSAFAGLNEGLKELSAITVKLKAATAQAPSSSQLSGSNTPLTSATTLSEDDVGEIEALFAAMSEQFGAIGLLQEGEVEKQMGSLPPVILPVKSPGKEHSHLSHEVKENENTFNSSTFTVLSHDYSPGIVSSAPSSKVPTDLIDIQAGAPDDDVAALAALIERRSSVTASAATTASVSEKAVVGAAPVVVEPAASMIAIDESKSSSSDSVFFVVRDIALDEVATQVNTTWEKSIASMHTQEETVQTGGHAQMGKSDVADFIDDSVMSVFEKRAAGGQNKIDPTKYVGCRTSSVALFEEAEASLAIAISSAANTVDNQNEELGVTVQGNESSLDGESTEETHVKQDEISRNEEKQISERSRRAGMKIVKMMKRYLRNVWKYRQMRFTIFHAWLPITATRVFSVLLGWRVRTIMRSSIVTKEKSELSNLKKVLNDICEGSANFDEQSADDLSLMDTVQKDIAAVKCKVYGIFFEGCKWVKFPAPGYWDLTHAMRLTIRRSRMQRKRSHIDCEKGTGTMHKNSPATPTISSGGDSISTEISKIHSGKKHFIQGSDRALKPSEIGNSSTLERASPRPHIRLVIHGIKNMTFQRPNADRENTRVTKFYLRATLSLMSKKSKLSQAMEWRSEIIETEDCLSSAWKVMTFFNLPCPQIIPISRSPDLATEAKDDHFVQLIKWWLLAQIKIEILDSEQSKQNNLIGDTIIPLSSILSPLDNKILGKSDFCFGVESKAEIQNSNLKQTLSAELEFTALIFPNREEEFAHVGSNSSISIEEALGNCPVGASEAAALAHVCSVGTSSGVVSSGGLSSGNSSMGAQSKILSTHTVSSGKQPSIDILSGIVAKLASSENMPLRDEPTPLRSVLEEKKKVEANVHENIDEMTDLSRAAEDVTSKGPLSQIFKAADRESVSSYQDRTLVNSFKSAVLESFKDSESTAELLMQHFTRSEHDRILDEVESESGEPSGDGSTHREPEPTEGSSVAETTELELDNRVVLTGNAMDDSLKVEPKVPLDSGGSLKDRILNKKRTEAQVASRRESTGGIRNRMHASVALCLCSLSSADDDADEVISTFSKQIEEKQRRHTSHDT
jgi:hypothetical protein